MPRRLRTSATRHHPTSAAGRLLLGIPGKARTRAAGRSVEVGKSFLAQALGYAAFHDGHTGRFSHADDILRTMSQARVDNSVERIFQSFLTPDLLILDDLGLYRLTGQQSADLYDLILNRHRASRFFITSNRAMDFGRLGLFEEPILGNNPLDRLANAGYQIVIDGSSYLERLSPHRALLGIEEVIDPAYVT